MTPAEIFRAAESGTIEVFALAINPFLVNDRVQPRVGSGFAVGNGYYVTNYHVVADSEQIGVEIGGYFSEAMVVGIDPALDVAVIRALFGDAGEAGLTFAVSEEVQIGDASYVLGYPMGLGKSFAAGMVTGVNRVLPRTTTSWLSPFIQTDAAISPGNSGGPLLNECGHVIGMVTAAMNSSGAEDIGFAIPTSVLRPVIDELIEKGKVSRPWHGLYGQMVTPEILMMLGAPAEVWADSTGFLVETVEPGSAAERLGLHGGTWPVRWGGKEVLLGGDIVTHVNGRRIESLETALSAVRALKVGEEVTVRYLRFGEELTGTVKLEERPILEQELEIYRHALIGR